MLDVFLDSLYEMLEVKALYTMRTSTKPPTELVGGAT